MNCLKKSRLLALPAEIRDQICSDVLRATLHDDDGHKSYHFDLALLRTCKQIYQEGRRRLHIDHTFVSIKTPWKEAPSFVHNNGKIPIIAMEESGESFPLTRLSVVIDAPIMGVGATSRFILLSTDLAAFCRHWFYQSLNMREMNAHLHLCLTLNNIENPDDLVKASRQKELLEPFGIIKDLNTITFIGAEAGVEKRTRELMAVPLETPTECLTKVENLKDEGNNALKKGQFEEARRLYIAAFGAMHIIVSGRERAIHGEAYFETELSKSFEGETNGRVVYFKLRAKLVANMLMALLKLEQWDEAVFWGMRSITLLREVGGPLADNPNGQIPYPADWGRVCISWNY